jgi:ribose transport system substrate-binding protein
MKRNIPFWIFLLAGCGWLSSCSRSDELQPLGRPALPASKKYVLAFSPKMLDNPVFNRAKIGAEKTAKDLSAVYGKIEILWSAPTEGDAAKQVEIVQGFINRRVNGIAVSCNNPDALKPVIDAAIDAEIPTITFDSDSPDSNRITYYGTNDVECGEIIAMRLHQIMGGKGTFAILTGVPGAYNLETRIQALKDKLQELNSGLQLVQTVYCNDDIAQSVQQIEQVMRGKPNLGGWAMVGGWPLMTDNALNSINPPGQCKIVAVDTLPEMWQYLEKGYVDTLIGQKVYHWGAESVSILMNLISGNKQYERNTWSGVDLVTKENLPEYKKKWREWFNEDVK